MIVPEYSIFRVESLKSRRSEIKTIPQQHKTEMPQRLGAVLEAGKISATLLGLAFPKNNQRGLTQWGTARSSAIHKWRDWLTCIKTEKSFRIHIPMHITKGTTGTAMGQGLENMCEVVGQGSFTSPNACHLSNVAWLSHVRGTELWQTTAATLTPWGLWRDPPQWRVAYVSEHRFPAPSSKLCQISLRHCRGTLYLRAAVQWRGQRPPKGSGTNNDCRSNLAPKHAQKHEMHPSRVKAKQNKKQKQNKKLTIVVLFCAGVNFAGTYKWHALFYLSCL